MPFIGDFGGLSGDERALDSLEDEVAEINCRLRKLETLSARKNVGYVNVGVPGCYEPVRLIEDCNILGILEEEGQFAW